MLERFVPSYYAEEWEDGWEQGRNYLIQSCLQEAEGDIDRTLFERLQDGWFHDAYLIQVSCNSSQMVNLTIKKHNEIVTLTFQQVISAECTGPLISAKCSFPYDGKNEKPLAQILAIWVEKVKTLKAYILLDNERVLYVKCQGKMSWEGELVI